MSNSFRGDIADHERWISNGFQSRDGFCGATKMELHEPISYKYFFPEVAVRAADLRVADFENAIFDIDGFFTGCNFSGANFRNVRIRSRIDFSGSIFNSADLRGITTDRDLSYGEFSKCTFRSAIMSGSTIKGGFEKAKFAATDMANSTLSGNFTKSDFSFADLNDATLCGNFNGSDLRFAKFDHITIGSEASFVDAKLPRDIESRSTGLPTTEEVLNKHFYHDERGWYVYTLLPFAHAQCGIVLGFDVDPDRFNPIECQGRNHGLVCSTMHGIKWDIKEDDYYKSDLATTWKVMIPRDCVNKVCAPYVSPSHIIRCGRVELIEPIER